MATNKIEKNMRRCVEVIGSYHDIDNEKELERVIKLMREEEQKIFVARWGLDGSKWCYSYQKLAEKLELANASLAESLYLGALYEVDRVVNTYNESIFVYDDDQFENVVKYIRFMESLEEKLSSVSFEELKQNVDEFIQQLDLKKKVVEDVVKEKAEKVTGRIQESYEKGTLKEDAKKVAKTVGEEGLKASIKAFREVKKAAESLAEKSKEYYNSLNEEEKAETDTEETDSEED